MQKNTEHIPNRDDVSTAILQHLDGLRGIDTHCHHLPDDQFQNMGVKFLYDHSYCNWMDDLLGLLHSYSNVYADLCWLPLISTSAAKRFLREALEIGGSIASSGAVIHGPLRKVTVLFWRSVGWCRKCSRRCVRKATSAVKRPAIRLDRSGAAMRSSYLALKTDAGNSNQFG